MMIKNTLLIFACFIYSVATAQFNFGFESFKPGTDTLLMWNRKSGPSYYGPLFDIDTKIKHSGKQSLSIERRPTDTATKFTPISIVIPVNFEGEKLQFSGWLKTENVTGFAQLWLRIDNKKEKLLTLVNYPQNNLKGTTDWKEYINNITIPEDAHTIQFGFLINGTGKVWADDLNIKVDYQPLAKAIKNPKKIYPASKDNEVFVNGSGISLTSLTPTQQAGLAQLAKVWGFLKYYHPYIAKGNVNWDYELFRFLPAFLTATNSQDQHQLLLKWINKYPSPDVCQNCTETVLDKAIYKPDLQWIYDKEILGEALSATLHNIKINRHQGVNYYMDLSPGVLNPVIKHEPGYGQFTYPDAGYRLLGLFRYWNIIQYWFPYKHLIGEDWKAVLNEFIPKMVEAQNTAAYTLTTQQLIGRIHDTHANIWGSNKVLDSLKGKLYPPVKLSFVGNLAVVSKIINPTLAIQSNLQLGDVIHSINGKAVNDIIEEKLPNLPASNLPTQLRDLAMFLLRGNDSTARLAITRNNQPLETTLFRSSPKKIADWYQPDYSHQQDSTVFFIEPGIGYLNLGTIQLSQVDSVFNVFKSAKGLVIDCRQYPSSFALYAIAGKLLPKRTMFTKIPVGSLQYPGMFNNKEPLYAGKKNPKYLKGKVVILVNEQTQSSAEFHSMAFRRAPNAIVMGSTTAGADGNVSGLYLPGNLYTMFSGISILNPDGTETQRVGIVPDIEVKRTVKGIKEGKDELLIKALEQLKL
jgi:C-terminal processing protease CtpA/Prc